MYWIIGALIIVLSLQMIRYIPQGERALLVLAGKPTNKVVGPGLVLILPFVQKLQRVSIEPFSLSLPIQSAITRDEVPIQLQASIDAEVSKPQMVFNGVRDWRIQLVSHLQLLMKDKLEELDFDHLDSAFPSWTQSVRGDLEAHALNFGVRIKGLSISNLSPRSRPVED